MSKLQRWGRTQRQYHQCLKDAFSKAREKKGYCFFQSEINLIRVSKKSTVSCHKVNLCELQWPICFGIRLHFIVIAEIAKTDCSQVTSTRVTSARQQSQAANQSPSDSSLKYVLPPGAGRACNWTECTQRRASSLEDTPCSDIRFLPPL